jgi:alkanesulfonate monooxygenase SsuD/methylene tetrahydromethanopterin reductase-like flavin-dependent oxidoreductase (luciferase family)
MKFGIDLPIMGPYGDVNVLVDLARETERAGWDGFFIWDQITGFGADNVADVQVTLAAVAIATTRIKLGCLITPLARRRPAKYAREAMTLDRLSGGRLVCGVGLGNSTEEFEDLGEPGNLKLRAELLDESLDIVTGLWSQQPFSYEGKHHKIHNANFLPTPVQQPRIPIWVGGVWGNSKAPFRRAARWDGTFPLWKDAGLGGMMPVEEYPKVIEFVKSERKSDAPFDVIHVGKSPGDAAEAAAVVKPYADAGVTWWLENISPWAYGGDANNWDTDTIRARIAAGPPRV